MRKVIGAGNVLTKELLIKVNKEAYHCGGFEVEGEVIKKTTNNLDAKTTVLIPRRFIKGKTERFLNSFSKTMNSWYYNIKLVDE
jgi:hypothetical protein